MASLFTGWLHGIVHDGPAKLSKRRKSILTPTSSSTDLSSPSRQDGTANSPLFQKLPAEIRLQILTAAFGQQTLHMDVMLSHPPSKYEPPGQQTILGHAGIFIAPSDTSDGRFYPKLDRTSRPSWQWYGSICHRNPPGVDTAGAHSVQPCQDQCRNGITPDNNCSLWPGTSPEKCRIGAMGWLRSCRQAYIEGIDILYSTNTIHTCSKALILDADRLLLPQRVASITSLELLWDFGPHPPWADSFPSKTRELLESFEDMLRSVRSSFRGLKNLYISVQWTEKEPTVTYSRHPQGGGAAGEPAESLLMRKVDALVRQLPARVAAFSLAIPSSIYQAQCNEAKETPGRSVEHVSDGARYERFWRPVGNHGGAHNGYWVRLGQRDIRLAAQTTMSDELLPHEWILYAQ